MLGVLTTGGEGTTWVMIGAAFCCGAYDWDAEIPIVPEIGTTIDWEPEAEEEDEEDEEDDDDDDPAIATVWLTAGLTVLLEIGTATGRTVSDYLFIIAAVAPLAKLLLMILMILMLMIRIPSFELLQNQMQHIIRSFRRIHLHNHIHFHWR